MGCASSKRVEVAASDVYRPPPSSFAVFDITSVKEPWLDLDALLNKPVDTQQQLQSDKPSLLPAPILHKLNTLETDNSAPQSWDEVSKALQLQDLNTQTKSDSTTTAAVVSAVVSAVKTAAIDKKETSPLPKSASFHTLEELEAKLSKKPEKIGTRNENGNSTESTRPQLRKLTRSTTEFPAPEAGGVVGGAVIKPVKQNIFILKDRQERSKEGKVPVKWDPLSDFPEKCPPDGADSVVVYTTSLRGVRRTFEDCARVRLLFEVHRVVVDERDVSLDSGFLRELKELLGEEEGSGAGVPRVFVKGRYVGGAEKVVELNEAGKLGRILSWARVERVEGAREACGGCGDARFVPCLDCGGSCKVVMDGGVKERCPTCNENGLVRCPTCHS